MSTLPRRTAIAIFLAFAFAYFFSALIRAITATLSPTLTQEFSLSASDLGLLAGGYFLGFAATQLPLGRWLDRYGWVGDVFTAQPHQGHHRPGAARRPDPDRP